MILLVALLGLALQVSPQTTQIVQDWALPVIVLCMLLIPLVLAWEKGQERRGLERPGWKGERSPYPGLDAFTEDDDGVFFGRDREIRELVERLRPGSEPRSVAVTGPSGVGKSSLLHAGLLPRLAQQRRWIVVPSMTPEDDPFRGLAYCLADALGADAEAVAGELRREPAGLRRRVDELRRGRRNRSVLLVVDQAEELVTLTGDGERDDFLGMLQEALECAAEVGVLRGHGGAAVAVDWSADGRLVSASYDGTARIWADGGSVVLRGHADEVWDAAWSPDGARVATASRDRTVRVWNAAGGAEEAVLRGHSDSVRAVAWSPDGARLASASDDRTIRVHTGVHTGGDAEPLVLRGHEDTVRAVAWSPDGEQLASGSHDGMVRVWEARTGLQIMLLNVPQSAVRALAWSPDGAYLAILSKDREVQVRDVAQGVEAAVLTGHEGWIWSVAWSPDGRVLATASADRTVRLWDPQAGRELCVAAVHTDEVSDVGWSPDGTRVATASHDRTVRIWEAVTDASALVERARSRVFRALTPDERHALMIPAPRPAPEGDGQRPERANR